MVRPKKTNKQHAIIAIKDAAHNLGLLQVDFEEWIKADRPKIYKDYMGRDSLSLEYISECIKKPDYKHKLFRCFKSDYNRRVSDRVDKQNEYFKSERTKLLKDYNQYIKDLESLHTKYLNKIDIFGSEIAITAAYILFARVISLLNLMRDCIERDYCSADAILRDIDETLDVALYFIISESTTVGQKNLKKWFRANEAPKHMICREVIAEWKAAINPEYDKENNKSLMNELYHKKSKWVHPTLNSIRDIIRYNISNDKIRVEGFDYHVCSYERRLYELAQFFRASIWSSFQIFFLCFRLSMPMDKEDIELLLNYDKLFQKLDAINTDW